MANILGLARTSLQKLPNIQLSPTIYQIHSICSMSSLSFFSLKPHTVTKPTVLSFSRPLTSSMSFASVGRSFPRPNSCTNWFHSGLVSSEGVGFTGENSRYNLGMLVSMTGSALIEKFGLKSGQQVRWSGSLKAKGKPRGPLWRQRKGVSKESLQVVFELKRCKGDRQKERIVLQTSAARLLKMDLLMVLVELRRQDECTLAKQVFDMVRKEEWYKPDIYLYREMMDTLGKNKLIEDVEQLFKELQEGGLRPDAMILTELMGSYIRCGNVPRAYEVYEEIKRNDFKPDQITFELMCRGLKKSGDFERLKIVMDDCAEAFPNNPPPFSRIVIENGL